MNRIDKDAIGEVQVPANANWMAQTQRSINNFEFNGCEVMPYEIIEALIQIKMAAAISNHKFGILSVEYKDAIINTCQKIIDEGSMKDFPLVIFQTGSGTQTNMNVNEVIANRANSEIFDQPLGSKTPVHPNDNVNMSQSSNDVFPSAINIAVVKALKQKLLPQMRAFVNAIHRKVVAFNSIVKIGRTHLMDAVPMTVGQEFSAWEASFQAVLDDLEEFDKQSSLNALPLGGTAVGTGLNSLPNFDIEVCKTLSEITGFEFLSAANKFFKLSSITPLLLLAGRLNALAGAMLKMGNDIRLLCSGPRCGLSELNIPANEPGSSIMPGKVNPTQCESLTMVAVQIIGNCQCIMTSSTFGHLQLNVFLPLVGHNIIRSMNLACCSLINFELHCLNGISTNDPQIGKAVTSSLMLITALNPHLGYEACARIAQYAHDHNMTLKESSMQLGIISEQEFDKYVNPLEMANAKRI